MTLYLAEKVLKIKILLKAMENDTIDILDPLYNRGKIYDQLIMNAKIEREENVDINHRARHIV
jgi:hypothetical protein